MNAWDEAVAQHCAYARAGNASESTIRLRRLYLVRLAQHPRIVANKDAKGDLGGASWVMARTDLAYYSGDDMLNLPLLSVGAVGVVSVTGHLCAGRLDMMLACFEAGVFFARTEGIVPAPEANHAVKGAIDDASDVTPSSMSPSEAIT